MDRLKVGVIGVGKMGKYHVKAYNDLKDKCDLVGVFDLKKKPRDEIAKEYEIKAFNSINQLLKNVDAVSIVTPTSTHFEIAKTVINHDVNLLLEKPITAEIGEAEKLIKTTANKNLILQIGHIERFNPVIRALPQFLKDQTIRAIAVNRLGPYVSRIDDTDVVQDLMIHDIDIINSLLSGSIKDLSAYGLKTRSEKHMDHVNVSLKMDNEVLVKLTASRITNKNIRKMSITTDSSYIEVDYLNKKIKISDQKQEIINDYQKQQQPLQAQLSHFMDCIVAQSQPLVGGKDGLEALKIIKKIQNQIYS